jgi:hypothetical protein
VTQQVTERWVAPWWWWLTGLLLSLGAAAEVHSGRHGAWAVLPYVLLPTAVVLFLVWLSRHRVVVRDGVLHVPGARAPLTSFGTPEELSVAAYRQWRGPRAQRDAWVQGRPWLRRGVLVPVVDPEDDTPYWLIGSRYPEQLAEAIG